MIEPEALLVLPRLRVQNANAISSPLTWGFPGPTAFCGFVHALSRKLSQEFDVELNGTAVICHGMEAQVTQPAGKRTSVFNLTRNPVGKDGGSAALVEEGRTHLNLSLVIGVSGDGLHRGDDPAAIAERAHELAMTMRLAGGSILPPTVPLSKSTRFQLVDLSEGDKKKASRRIAHALLPGFALVSREELLHQHWEKMKVEQPECSSLDALLDLSRLNLVSKNVAAEGEAEKIEWGVRTEPGWLVPIPAGFASLSPLYPPGEVQNTRDRETPFRFVEGLFTIGQWLSPHRVEDLTQLMWRYEVNEDDETYRCTTPFYAAKV